MTLKRISAIMALAVGALLLTSCAAEPAASAPSNSSTAPSTAASTPSETPTVDPLTTVDTIVLNAETFTLRSGSTEVATLPLTDLPGTLATLTTVLGAPAVTETPADMHCTIENTAYDWGSALRLVHFAQRPTDPYAVRLLKPEVAGSAASDHVQLTGAGGVKVGDDITSLIAQTAPRLKESWSYEGVTHYTVILQQGYPDRTDVTGVAAFTDDGIVTVIGTPVPVHSNQDC